jgi:hypothetical protein
LFHRLRELANARLTRRSQRARERADDLGQADSSAILWLTRYGVGRGALPWAWVFLNPLNNPSPKPDKRPVVSSYSRAGISLYAAMSSWC